MASSLVSEAAKIAPAVARRMTGKCAAPRAQAALAPQRSIVQIISVALSGDCLFVYPSLRLDLFAKLRYNRLTENLEFVGGYVCLKK